MLANIDREVIGADDVQILEARTSGINGAKLWREGVLGAGVFANEIEGASMSTTMLKGLAITPPVIGRIAIGKVVERNGKRLLEMDDQFTLTTQVQDKDGGWRLHPLDESLRQQASAGKLRTIPVRLLFNDPALNLRAEYTNFDRKTGRPLCMGNGEQCQRVTVRRSQDAAVYCTRPSGVVQCRVPLSRATSGVDESGTGASEGGGDEPLDDIVGFGNQVASSDFSHDPFPCSRVVRLLPQANWRRGTVGR